MRVFSRSFEIWKSCWKLLKNDKELLLFPVFSGLTVILITATFLIPLSTLFGILGFHGNRTGEGLTLTHYFLIYLWYFVTSFIAYFFNSAVIGCANMRMEGSNPRLSDGFRIGFENLGRIAGWAAVSASVGVLLSLIERLKIGGDRGFGIGSVLRSILGLAWTVLTFLVLPILIIEKVGPIEALKRSGFLLKKTWGEQIVVSFGFGLVGFLLSLLAPIPIAIGFLIGSPGAIAIGFGLALIYILFIVILNSTLRSIFTAVLYRYAVKNEVPPSIPPTLVAQAFTPKR